MPAILDILAPGLLGPIPLPPELAPATPALDLLLARARPSSAAEADLTTALCRRFGVEAPAPYSLAADDPDWDRQGFWMHADPVHLRPDRDLLRLFDARHLGISQAEADALVAELNAHFGGDGLRFHAPVAMRWYLNCDTPPRLSTQPLELAVGQHVDGLLPAGPDAKRWASLMNEAQMLLFQSDVNRRRELDGRPAVNGLWLSGGGVWQPPRADDRRPDRVLGESALAPGLVQGLAQAAGSRWAPTAEVLGAGVLSDAGRTLLVWDTLQDAVLDTDERAWAAAAARLERDVAAGALAGLRNGRLDQLVIDVCDGVRRSVRRRDLLRVWRRPRPLASRLLPPR